ncbi:MAG: GatB/YqeY domain-containing protein [Candidatus Omnitrophica bacterium]|nr:GatB/YqeY domain-containing protein [Candidatus Omnitrophota bacterium]
MMTEKIDSDLKKAMKDKDAIRVSALRMLKAAISNKTIELSVEKLEDKEIVSLIRKDVKRHKDSIEQFKKGGRDDLASKEEAELLILNSYLPKEISEEEISKIVSEVIDETDSSGKKDIGRVMKLAMEKIKGRADGKTVSSIVSSQLDKKETKNRGNL